MSFPDKIHRIITGVENSKIPFSYFLLTYLFAITLRTFLETFLLKGGSSRSFETFSHYYISYICLALTLLVVFHLAVKEEIKKIARVILPCFFILILPPILDFILSAGKGYTITYLLPGTHENLLYRFFTFFGPFEKMGVTAGIKVEIALVLLASFTYIFLKRKNFSRSLFFSFLTYSLLFTYSIAPFLVRAFLSVFQVNYEPSDLLMRNFYLLLMFFLGTWLFYLYDKKYFFEILKDIRLPRILHYEFMFILGAVLSKIISPASVALTQNTLFHVMFLPMAILFACLFSLMTNNLTDYDIDKITNPARPTVTQTIPAEHYKRLSWIFLFLAVIYSSAVNFRSLFLTSVFIGNYFLYSMPPLRLKRVPFFSKLLLSLNALVLVMLGATFIDENVDIPRWLIIYFLTCLTAAINFIDIKDYEGDKHAGIKTLPTLLGLKKSKMFIGAFFLISYTVVYFLLRNICLWTLFIVLGGIQFYLINRKEYDERLVFLLYLSSVLLLILYLIFNPHHVFQGVQA